MAKQPDTACGIEDCKYHSRDAGALKKHRAAVHEQRDPSRKRTHEGEPAAEQAAVPITAGPDGAQAGHGQPPADPAAASPDASAPGNPGDVPVTDGGGTQAGHGQPPADPVSAPAPPFRMEGDAPLADDGESDARGKIGRRAEH